MKKISKSDKSTPMMEQYLSIKEKNSDCLLFYRMGDFYELFFEDAEIASDNLDITLTKRGSHKGEPIPMCGVPIHAAETYLSRLIRKGFRVAVCEQTESPTQAKERGSKVVQRDVVRIVTPGTLTEDNLLDARTNNYLCALTQQGSNMAVAWCDMSTGEFYVQDVTVKTLGTTLYRIAPSELIIPQKIITNESLFDVLADWQSLIHPLPDVRFDLTNGEKRLLDFYGVSHLSGFGDFSKAGIACTGALLDYIALTQVGTIPSLKPPRIIETRGILDIDSATRRSLELTHTQGGQKSGSLLANIDRTVTAAGARLLGARLASPLTDITTLNHRLDSITAAINAPDACHTLVDSMKGAPDLERAMTRLSLGRGGPRDLSAIAHCLTMTDSIKNILRQMGDPLPQNLQTVIQDLGHHNAIVSTLKSALMDDLPLLVRDGGFVKAGFNATLDKTRDMRDHSRQLIANLEQQYRDQTSIDSLKIKHNGVLGYFIEVTAKNAEKMDINTFIHRQSTANQARYTTTELSELARDITESRDKALALELDIFKTLCDDILHHQSEIGLAAAALAEIDWICAFATLASTENYCRPMLSTDFTFTIEGGRHPVVEQSLKKQGKSFITNHCNLNTGQKLWLLTGPNMAGKSTFLRQNALITIMAQMGVYVPADTCHIGVVDKLFSRVGASDDLARGQSTFMVEMVETATILNQATSRSLVILDEIGRGTSTFDGLSIAWSCVEHLHNTSQCRTLFATHYHELNTLANSLENISPHAMQVKEWDEEIVFLHTVGVGAANRSYGIHVARLAGLPPSVINRADHILNQLESNKTSGTIPTIGDLPLFQNLPPAQTQPAPEPQMIISPTDELLQTIDPNSLTPREALEALYELKSLLKK